MLEKAHFMIFIGEANRIHSLLGMLAETLHVIRKVKRALVMVLIILFVFMVLPYGRSTPRFEQQSKAQPHQGGNEAETYVAEESCEGLSEEECLMRRTLLAHTDYIYTQKQNP